MESEDQRIERKKQAKIQSYIRNITCKQCGKNRRANGSSRCSDCSQEHRGKVRMDRRLEAKILDQTK